MEFVHDIEEDFNELRRVDKYWTSYIEKENFEVGTLRLASNENDPQSPHTSDEIYLVLAGNGYLNIDGTDYEIKQNNSYFIPKNTKHYFHSNTEEILAFYVLN